MLNMPNGLARWRGSVRIKMHDELVTATKVRRLPHHAGAAAFHGIDQPVFALGIAATQEDRRGHADRSNPLYTGSVPAL